MGLVFWTNRRHGLGSTQVVLAIRQPQPALGGVPAVLLAAFVVRSLPLGAVRWLVVCVVLYTAAAMLRATCLFQSQRFSTSAI